MNQHPGHHRRLDLVRETLPFDRDSIMSQEFVSRAIAMMEAADPMDPLPATFEGVPWSTIGKWTHELIEELEA